LSVVHSSSSIYIFHYVLLFSSHLLSLFFFLSILRPPPTSTLFPYTTLFRSTVGKYKSILLPVIASPLSATTPYPYPGINMIVPRDRKSTRLNSSHVSISYAVFCLKKKKNK